MKMRHLRGKTIKGFLAVMFPPKMKMSLMFTPQNLPGAVFHVAHLTHVSLLQLVLWGWSKPCFSVMGHMHIVQLFYTLNQIIWFVLS